MGRESLVVACDVSDLNAVEDMVKQTVEAFGSLDLFVSNAVYSDRQLMVDADMDGFRRTIEVSMWGALHGVYLVVAHVWQGLARRMESWQRHPMGGIAGWALTFLAVLLAWVLFRAPDLPSASRMFHIMAGAEGFQAPKAIREVKFGVGELFLRILEPTENKLPLSSYQLLVRMVIVMLLAVFLMALSMIFDLAKITMKAGGTNIGINNRKSNCQFTRRIVFSRN